MVPFADLRAQYHSLKREIDDAIARTLESSQFILGREVEAFENEFAALHGCRHGIGVNSGTSALHLALLAAGIGPGHEVITTPFSFAASAASILYTGARPVYVDIDPATYNLDPSRIAAAITPRTRAIMPVHLFGQAADMDAILKIARHHRLAVIEDACQAHLAQYKGRPVGSLADVACFSFYPSKNLSAMGEGGAVVTNNPEIAKQVRLMRNWGMEQRYHHLVRGFNYRMEGFQGAILRVKLQRLAAWTETRRSLAAAYTRALSGSGLDLPIEMEWARHVYHVYCVATDHRDELQRQLTAREIQTMIYYPHPIHFNEPYRDPNFPAGSLPVAERAANRVLALPIYPEMPESAIAEVASAIAVTTPA